MRLASLSPAATEILFALGKGDDIVCTDQFSTFPEAAKSLPHLKDHQAVSPDALRAFAPELVFTGTVIQEKLAAQLRASGFAVIHHDPRAIHGIYESIRSIGTLLACEREAEQLVLLMQRGFNDVKRKAALLPRRPRIYVEEWHRPPMASGNWVPEIAAIAGGSAFPISSGDLSREVTLTEIAAFDPDMIVVSWCGAGSFADKQVLTGRSGWDALRSVASGYVRVIDDSLLNRPGPRLVEGAQRLYGWMFEMLH